MKRKPRFLIVLLSAAITFGVLMASLGKPPLMKHHQPGACHPPQTEQMQQP